MSDVGFSSRSPSSDWTLDRFAGREWQSKKRESKRSADFVVLRTERKRVQPEPARYLGLRDATRRNEFRSQVSPSETPEESGRDTPIFASKELAAEACTTLGERTSVSVASNSHARWTLRGPGSSTRPAPCALRRHAGPKLRQLKPGNAVRTPISDRRRSIRAQRGAADSGPCVGAFRVGNARLRAQPRGQHAVEGEPRCPFELSTVERARIQRIA